MIADDLEYVGFWPRVGASIIDTIIVMIITAPPLIWLYGWEYYTDIDRPLVDGPGDFLISWLLPAVGIVWFWLRKEATPGKMAIGARVVDAVTGRAISARQGIVRYLGYFVSTLPLCLGLLWVAFDPRKQGWHDKLAGTVVVRSRNQGPQPVKFGNG